MFGLPAALLHGSEGAAYLLQLIGRLLPPPLCRQGLLRCLMPALFRNCEGALHLLQLTLHLCMAPPPLLQLALAGNLLLGQSLPPTLRLCGLLSLLRSLLLRLLPHTLLFKKTFRQYLVRALHLCKLAPRAVEALAQLLHLTLGRICLFDFLPKLAPQLPRLRTSLWRRHKERTAGHWGWTLRGLRKSGPWLPETGRLHNHLLQGLHLVAREPAHSVAALFGAAPPPRGFLLKHHDDITFLETQLERVVPYVVVLDGHVR
mmetsp:Transcript_122157/g.260668  ORF Transcript_122157/g.260668 Transcript_122157/m.260668 type:complete len:260 (-) Transcript_122157:176-955(-)